MGKTRIFAVSGTLISVGFVFSLAGCGPEVIPLAPPDPAMIKKESDAKIKVPEKLRNPPAGTSAGIKSDPSGMDRVK